MTEQNLIDLGFVKTEVNEIEAGGSPFYYYVYDFTSHFSLITPANDEIEEGKWRVDIFEHSEVSFKEVEDLKLFMEVVKRNTTE